MERFVVAAFGWAAGLSPRIQAGEPNEAFALDSADRLIRILANPLEIRASDRIELEIPDVAEDGALVPITISSSLDNVRAITVIAEKNPVPLIGRFDLENGAEPFVQARIKMAGSGYVIVLVNAENGWHRSQKFVTVTAGGCGG